MNEDTDTKASDDVVVCPECGEDVCVVHGTSRRWPHPSRVIPIVVWSFLLAGVLFASTPWVGSLLGNRQAIWTSTQPSVDASARVQSPLISVPAIRLSAQDHTKFQKELIDLVESILERKWVAGSRDKMQFVLVEPDGMSIEYGYWGIGGRWFQRSSNIALKDLRDPTSTDPEAYQYSRSYWSWFPISHSQVKLGGAQVVYTSIDLFVILAMIAVCMALVYVLSRLGGRMRIQILTNRLSKVVLFLVLISIVVVGAVNHSYSSQFPSARGKEIGATSWYSLDELRSMVSENGSVDHLIEEITQAIPSDRAGDLLLGEMWDRGYETIFKMVEFGMGDQLQLCSGSRMDFFEEHPDGTSTQIAVPDPLHPGLDFGNYGLTQVRIGWASGNTKLSFGFNLPHLILAIVLFYWIWKGLHRIAQVGLGIVQRKRVRRNQCIFCAYPLSEEARIARSLADSAPPSDR